MYIVRLGGLYSFCIMVSIVISDNNCFQVGLKLAKITSNLQECFACVFRLAF